ncbi:MAG: hypothetical protein FD156_1981 [Nitrospirae bacterium]|nr:MAG: hypothetical protein FD156_1981 [Nitrospirota bacterium]
MQNKKFVFIITHSYDNPDKVAGAMQVAANMATFDAEIAFFLMDKGALLAKKGFAETLTWQTKGQFSPVADLMKTLIEDFKIKFYICEACYKYHELNKAELIPNSEPKTGSYLGEMLFERQGLTF